MVDVYPPIFFNQGIFVSYENGLHFSIESEVSHPFSFIHRPANWGTSLEAFPPNLVPQCNAVKTLPTFKHHTDEYMKRIKW